MSDLLSVRRLDKLEKQLGGNLRVVCGAGIPETAGFAMFRVGTTESFLARREGFQMF